MTFNEFIAESKKQLELLNWRAILPWMLLIVIADQATKHYFDSTLVYNNPVEVIGDSFRLTLHYNKGIAFGLRLFQNQAVFVLFSILAVVFIFFYLITLELTQKQKHIVLILVIGGAIGNIIDRAFLGQVIDFIDVEFWDIDIPAFSFLGFDFSGFYMTRWPIFNIADSAVSVGMVTIISMLTFSKKAEVEETHAE